MESMKLPTKLGKEPLIDAVFELRFSSNTAASNILPGALFALLVQDGQGVSVEKLPLSQIPESVRRADPNLQFAPVVKLNWQCYALLISDGSIGVSCNMPYPGWLAFREAISKVVAAVAKVGIINSLDRYSAKYVDIVPIPDIQSQVQGLNLQLRIGGHELKSEVASVRIEVPRGAFLHLVSIQTGALVEIAGRPRIEGVVVDVDSVCKTPELQLSQFIDEMTIRLDDIHMENKAMFFECLTPNTVTALEPHYE